MHSVITDDFKLSPVYVYMHKRTHTHIDTYFDISVIIHSVLSPILKRNVKISVTF